MAVGSKLLSPGSVLALEGGPELSALKAVVIGNPLASYPQRDWEATYRNLAAPDSQFHFLCAPNDTHNCLLRAFVKNGIIVRIGPSYGYGKATDIYGNQATARWDPRCCKKGLSLMRRVHGNRCVTRPMIRQGFKKWVDDGFPRGADGLVDASYLKRGQEPFTALSWDDAFTYAAKALMNIAETYKGPEGRALLAQQGYEPEMLDAMHEAGTQVLKFRGGMPFLGATRIIGMYRYANSMALLDANVRGVLPAAAYGGRGWDNYAWHTDLPPGHTLVTGQQTIDFDLALVENSEVVTLWGMNWIVTKMPDSHWLTEARLKGTKVIVIACEYQATANKADEVVIIRPATDSALALGIANIPLDPADPAWADATPANVPLSAQNVQAPRGGGQVSQVEVRALHSGREFAVRLTWQNASVETVVGVRKFRDAAAVMFPVAVNPMRSSMMGHAGAPVLIWQWKADWEDFPAAYAARMARYPDYTDFHHPTNDQLNAQFGDKPGPKDRVDVLVAEGFGSATRVGDAVVEAKSARFGEFTRVVFRRSLPATAPALVPGTRSAINVAVWDGASENRGSRKSVSMVWVDLLLEAPPQAPVFRPPQLDGKMVALGLLLLAAGVVFVVANERTEEVRKFEAEQQAKLTGVKKR